MFKKGGDVPKLGLIVPFVIDVAYMVLVLVILDKSSFPILLRILGGFSSWSFQSHRQLVTQLLIWDSLQKKPNFQLSSLSSLGPVCSEEIQASFDMNTMNSLLAKWCRM